MSTDRQVDDLFRQYRRILQTNGRWPGPAENVQHQSAEAQVLNGILEPAPGMHPVDREELIAGLEVTTDLRIERYWQLTATINGWPPFPSHMPGDLWLLAALRAHR